VKLALPVEQHYKAPSVADKAFSLAALFGGQFSESAAASQRRESLAMVKEGGEKMTRARLE